MVDNGAMINAIDMNMYQSVARRMAPLHPSNWTLQITDRSLLPSSGIWLGEFAWGPMHTETTFKVFPSRNIRKWGREDNPL